MPAALVPGRALLQHPGDALREILGLERLGQIAGALVLDDVGQAAGIEGDHWCAAGVGLHSCIGQIVLPRGDHHRISGAVEHSQAEVVMQVAGVVDGETE